MQEGVTKDHILWDPIVWKTQNRKVKRERKINDVFRLRGWKNKKIQSLGFLLWMKKMFWNWMWWFHNLLNIKKNYWIIYLKWKLYLNKNIYFVSVCFLKILRTAQNFGWWLYWNNSQHITDDEHWVHRGLGQDPLYTSTHHTLCTTGLAHVWLSNLIWHSLYSKNNTRVRCFKYSVKIISISTPPPKTIWYSVKASCYDL